MKKGTGQKNIPVKDDEKYLEGINLVTGDKIDYSRHILTETEINALCVNEKLSKVQKFIQIMMEGDKIQKWSMFENITLYVENQDGAENILTLIQKNYEEYGEFLAIMGQGISKYISKCKTNTKLLSKKCYQIIFRLISRTVTSPKFQGSQILTDWMLVIHQFFSIPVQNDAVSKKAEKITELTDYINSSFSMNTLPQRRKTALEMINALFQSSHQVQVQSHSKVLFFNNDLNPSTRLVICSIMDKILRRQCIPEIWKCVLQYYLLDKSLFVREKALKTISQVYYQPNAESIFNNFDQQKIEMLTIIANSLPTLLRTYEEQVKKDPLNQLKLFSFLNRLLRKNPDSFIGKFVESYKELTYALPETVLIKELQLKKFQLESPKVMVQLINLYEITNHLEFREELKKQILKGLRYHEFYLKMKRETSNKLLDMLELDVEQDIGVYILMLGKQIEASQWKTLQVFFERITQLRLNHSQLEKIVGHVMKVYVGTPYFLLEQLHQVILHLLMIDRKGMEIYLKVRQKCLGAKNWILRRNFIKLYTYFKMNASFEFNKFITPLVYKNIVNEKTVLIKIQFVRQFIQAYAYLDPTLPQEKISIKQVISRFSEDRDYELSQLAQKALIIFKQIDRDSESLNKIIARNKQLHNRQILIEQIIVDQKKHVKTQKIIGKIYMRDFRDKPKKTSLVGLVQTKTSTNLNKLHQGKQIYPQQKPGLVRSNSTQNKKEANKARPPAYKKTRLI